MGFPRAGLVMLSLTIVGYTLACIHVWWLAGLMHLIGFIEGVIYLTKSDTDFYRDYVIYKNSGSSLSSPLEPLPPSFL